MMTTLTTVLGLLPMALGLGEGSEMRTPMAITVIGGLLTSTMLTLLVVPVMYSLLDRRTGTSTETRILHEGGPVNFRFNHIQKLMGKRPPKQEVHVVLFGRNFRGKKREEAYASSR
jgi:predicted RND superfamily exporter protein